MSYARKGPGSDVYIWTDGATPDQGHLHCQECPLLDGGVDVVTRSQARMLEHLAQHARAGHKVPPEATNRLRYEWEQVSDTSGT